jgi:hypothetical protein
MGQGWGVSIEFAMSAGVRYHTQRPDLDEAGGSFSERGGKRWHASYFDAA